MLSPHPDDAVWSVGGRLHRWARLDMDTTVVTVFDGDGEGARAPGRWRTVANPAVRRAEDTAALARIRARRVSLGLPEAATRTDRGVPRYRNPLRLFGPVHELDTALPEAVADGVAGILSPQSVVHAPLAAGGHVDHRLVREAANVLAGRGFRVCFYEDFPYRVRPEDHEGLRPGHAQVDLDEWLAASAHYRSQVDALFSSAVSFETALRARARAHAKETPWRHAERFWSI